MYKKSDVTLYHYRGVNGWYPKGIGLNYLSDSLKVAFGTEGKTVVPEFFTRGHALAPRVSIIEIGKDFPDSNDIASGLIGVERQTLHLPFTYINKAWVHPAFRGDGLLAKMVEMAVLRSLSDGRRVMVRTTMEHARRVYEQLLTEKTRYGAVFDEHEKIGEFDVYGAGFHPLGQKTIRGRDIFLEGASVVASFPKTIVPKNPQKLSEGEMGNETLEELVA